MHRNDIILACSFATFFVISAEKNLMMIKDRGDIWISTQNFASIIEVSLNLSVCTNVYLSGSSRGIDDLFDVFMRAYPYDYLINEIAYACTGYFMLSTSIDTLMKTIQRTPTKFSITQILIVIDDEVEESTEIFNVSIYENANVNIAAVNGLWTLSENMFNSRKFKKVFRYDEMAHRRGIMDLKGRELQAATDFNRPLSFLKTTVNRTINGIDAKIFVSKDESELDGVEIKLFLLMAERLNFTWTMRSPSNNYRFGQANGTGWSGGLIGQIYDKEVDIAFSGIWLELPQYTIADLTAPWMQLDVRFLVPRPKPHASFWALARPLSPKVWLGIIAMMITQSIYVYTRSRLNPRAPKRFRNFAVTCTELMARLLGVSVNKKLRGFKLQFQLWHMIGVLLVTAYSSSLAARLSSSEYEKRIDTIEQFVEANLTWGREGNLLSFSSLSDVSDPWMSELLSRFESELDEEERHRKILKGNYAILGRVVSSVFFPENLIRDEDMKAVYKGYRVMKNHVGQFYTSFVVQPWLLESCDQVMLWLREAGFVDYHLRDVLRRRTATAYREVQIEYDDLATGPRVLGLTPLGAAFIGLAIGHILSAVVFCFELRSVR